MDALLFEGMCFFSYVPLLLLLWPETFFIFMNSLFNSWRGKKTHTQTHLHRSQGILTRFERFIDVYTLFHLFLTIGRTILMDCKLTTIFEMSARDILLFPQISQLLFSLQLFLWIASSVKFKVFSFVAVRKVQECWSKQLKKNLLINIWFSLAQIITHPIHVSSAFVRKQLVWPEWIHLNFSNKIDMTSVFYAWTFNKIYSAMRQA